MKIKLKLPFVYYGGKRLAASKIWEILGDVPLYIEPFCGSAAVHILRPQEHKNYRAILNDANGYIVNFYRALAVDPEGVAQWCNWPMTEADMHARHRWLVLSDEVKELKEKVRVDPDFYNLKLAGWWVYGVNLWIGDKWCISRKTGLPDKYLPGQKKPSSNCLGAHRQEYDESGLPYGPGLKPSNRCQGIHRYEYDESGLPTKLITYLKTISVRLRYARILMGDWKRVFTKSEYLGSKTVGIFFDPPYDGHSDTYGGKENIAEEVRLWCIDHTKHDNLRIVLSGYNSDNDVLLSHGWSKIQIGVELGMKRDISTRRLEYIWCSPSCSKFL